MSLATLTERPAPAQVTRGYHIPVYRCTLVKEGTQRTEQRPVVNDNWIAASVLRDYFAGADREWLVVLLLDVRLRIIGINTVSVGTLTESLVSPREVFKPALLLGAVAIILAHNHPSGDPEPSPEDLRATKKIVAAGRLLDIAVEDHIIIGENTHVSLGHRKLMG